MADTPLMPFEGTINTAIEKIADGINAKLDRTEEKRNREFTYQLKELEFYKSSYGKDLKDIFDFWFDLVRITHIKDNTNLTDQEKLKYEKQQHEMLSVTKISRYKMNTLKYGGKETGRVLAIESKLHQVKYADQPKFTPMVMWCSLLAVLKKDILGQVLDPMDIIQVLVADFDDYIEELEETKKYIKKVYKKTYNEVPYWLE